MRVFLFIISMIWTCSCHAQIRKGDSFKKTAYSYIYNELYQQTIDTIAIENGPVDIYFFNNHLKLPADLPQKLTDKRYAGQTISETNPNAEGNVQSNWGYSTSYDSIGRVVNFSYSSCMACSSFPYSYSITYDSKGQLTTISNKLGLQDRFECYYDDKGNIIKLTRYSSELLEIEITLIR